MHDRTVLLLHVPYLTSGGEDMHVQMLCEAYLSIGATPILLPHRRKQINPIRLVRSLLPGSSMPELDALMKNHNPTLIHIHNPYPSLGPRMFRWVLKQKTPVLFTAHNHRFYCTNGLALLQGKPCRRCLNKRIPWPALWFNCNQNLAKTLYHFLAMSSMRLSNLLSRSVTLFIAPSEYIKEELQKTGISPSKIRVLPHPVKTTVSSNPAAEYADVIYVGRLSQEKGIHTLLAAAEQLPNISFLIIGDGPEAPKVKSAASHSSNIQHIQSAPHGAVLSSLKKCRLAVIPSICNESLSLFLLEAFSQGKPCVVSRTEAFQWLRSSDLPYVYFEPGNPIQLKEGIKKALDIPAVTSEALEKIQTRFGMARFLQGLREAIESVSKA